MTKGKLNKLSDAISVVSQAVSVETANRVSAVAAVNQAVSVVSAHVDIVSNAVSNETSNRVSADGVLSAAITNVSNAISNELSARTSAVNVVSNALSNEISVRTSAVAAALNAVSIVSVHVDTVSNAVSNEISNRTSAVNVVSNAVSNEISVRTSAVNAVSNALSNEISNRTSAVNVVSNAVSNEISNRISAVNALSAAIAAVSVKSVGGTSVRGLQSVLNALSNRISVVVVGGGGSVTSTEVSAGDAAVSAQAASALSVEVANRISADNALSAAIAAVSVKSVGGTSVRGLQSVLNALSNQISAVSNQASVVSAQAASIVSVVANNLSNEISNRVSADNALSTRINTLSVQVSAWAAVSVKSVGGTSVKGLQSVLNALSNRISATTGGTGSVTSTEVSAGDAAVSAQAASALAAAISNRISADDALSVRLDVVSASVSAFNHVSARSAGNVSVQGMQSVIDAISGRLSALGAIVVAEGVSIQGLSALLAPLLVVSAKSAGGTSVQGLQSILDALSNRISATTGGTGSVTSTELSAVSATALNNAITLTGLLLVKTGLINGDAGALSAGQPVYALLSADQAAKASAGHSAYIGLVLDASVAVGGTFNLQHNGIVSLPTTAWDGVTGGTGGLTPGALYYLATTPGTLSVVPGNPGSGVPIREIGRAIDTAHMILHDPMGTAENVWLSALVIQSFVTLSTVISALGASVAVLSAGLGAPQMRTVAAAQNISAVAFTNVSGLSLSVTSAATYQIEGRVLFSLSTITGTAFGCTFPTGITPGSMTMECFSSVFAANNITLISTNYSYNRITETGMSTVATTVLSLLGGTSATTYELEIYGVVRIGATAGTIQLQAKQSATGGAIRILNGSYFKAFKVQ